MKAHVRTNFPRPPAELVEKIAAFSSSTIYEEQGRRGALDPRIRPIANDLELCGPAFTIQAAPGDNLMLQAGIHFSSPGDVLVVSAGFFLGAGFLGNVLATACQAKDIRGLVIDSGVRDLMALRQMRFPVFSLGICMRTATKSVIGPAGYPVVVAGQLIQPGDIIRGDADGVVVVRPDEAADIAERCAARKAGEAQRIAAYKAGVSHDELRGLKDKLTKMGLTFDE